MDSISSVSDTPLHVVPEDNLELQPQVSESEMTPQPEPAKPAEVKEASDREKDTIEPAPKPSYFSWLPISWPTSKPQETKQQIQNRPVMELRDMWTQAYLELAEVEYEVMQLYARVSAYRGVDPFFAKNRDLLQQIKVMRPNASKAQEALDQMEKKLQALRSTIDEGRTYFTKVLEIEKLNYEVNFFDRATTEVCTKADLSRGEVVLFLKKCQQEKRELLCELGKLKKELGDCPLLIKA